MNWFQKFLSIDEAKSSSLIVVLFFFSGLSAYSVIKFGDIPTNLAMVLSSLIIAIGGVNAFMNRTNATYPISNYTNYNTTSSTLPLQTTQTTMTTTSSMPKM